MVCLFVLGCWWMDVVVRCLLFGICCLLWVVCCASLFVVGGCLYSVAVRCYLLLCVLRSSLLILCCLRFGVCSSLCIPGSLLVWYVVIVVWCVFGAICCCVLLLVLMCCCVSAVGLVVGCLLFVRCAVLLRVAFSCYFVVDSSFFVVGCLLLRFYCCMKLVAVRC